MIQNQSRTVIESFCALSEETGRPIPAQFAFLRQHGRQMPVSDFNAIYESRGEMGYCYANSGRAAQLEGLWYCEGYAVAKGVPLPLPHAWMCDEQGRVIDPTWPDGSDYFGVPFTEAFYSECALQTGYHGILCNLYLIRSKRARADMLAYLASGVAHPADMCV